MTWGKVVLDKIRAMTLDDWSEKDSKKTTKKKANSY